MNPTDYPNLIHLINRYEDAIKVVAALKPRPWRGSEDVHFPGAPEAIQARDEARVALAQALRRSAKVARHGDWIYAAHGPDDLYRHPAPTSAAGRKHRRPKAS